MMSGGMIYEAKGWRGWGLELLQGGQCGGGRESVQNVEERGRGRGLKMWEKGGEEGRNGWGWRFGHWGRGNRLLARQGGGR